MTATGSCSFYDKRHKDRAIQHWSPWCERWLNSSDLAAFFAAVSYQHPSVYSILVIEHHTIIHVINGWASIHAGIMIAIRQSLIRRQVVRCCPNTPGCCLASCADVSAESSGLLNVLWRKPRYCRVLSGWRFHGVDSVEIRLCGVIPCFPGNGGPYCWRRNHLLWVLVPLVALLAAAAASFFCLLMVSGFCPPSTSKEPCNVFISRNRVLADPLLVYE